MEKFCVILRTLYLVRHAYTPNTSSENDFDRAIKQEERAHIQNLSPSIKNCLKKIDTIYCSKAVRTKQTCEMFQPYFLKNPDIFYCDVLYSKKEIYSEIIWDLLREVPDSKEHVMVIGHNPGLTDFYNSLPIPNYEFIHFPTLGLATIQFVNTLWQEISSASAVERHIYCA